MKVNKKILLSFFLTALPVMIALHVSAQLPGAALFDDTLIHTIELNFSQPDYWQQLTNNKAFDDANDSSTYIPATVIVDGNVLDSTGVQFKGNSSYYNYPTNKKPFTLSFDQYISGQEYDDEKSINLNNGYQDPTMLREKMFLDFCQQANAPAPRANYAKLYINGDYWGLYLMCERVNRKFCSSRFGNNDGNLFKGDKGSSACATLQYHAVMSAYTNCYTLKTNTDVNDWSDLIFLCYEINQTTDAEFNDSVNAVLNTSSFINAWAAYNLLADFDSYPYRFKHNYYVYHNTSTNKFEFIIWDVSTAFGIDIPMEVSDIENISVLYLTPPVADAPLTNRMLNDPVFKVQYLQTVCELVNNFFIPSLLNAKVDLLANRIRNDYYDDSLKMFSNQNFEDNLVSNINLGYDIPGLKSFITNRYAAVTAELSGLDVFCATGIAQLQPSSLFTVYPNPVNEELLITVPKFEKLFKPKITITDLPGRTLIANFSLTEISTTINTSKLANGIYFLTLDYGTCLSTQKFIVHHP